MRAQLPFNGTFRYHYDVHLILFMCLFVYFVFFLLMWILFFYTSKRCLLCGQRNRNTALIFNSLVIVVVVLSVCCSCCRVCCILIIKFMCKLQTTQPCVFEAVMLASQSITHSSITQSITHVEQSSIPVPVGGLSSYFEIPASSLSISFSHFLRHIAVIDTHAPFPST